MIQEAIDAAWNFISSDKQYGKSHKNMANIYRTIYKFFYYFIG
jgi:hypothetical protein